MFAESPSSSRVPMSMERGARRERERGIVKTCREGKEEGGRDAVVRWSIAAGGRGEKGEEVCFFFRLRNGGFRHLLGRSFIIVSQGMLKMSHTLCKTFVLLNHKPPHFSFNHCGRRIVFKLSFLFRICKTDLLPRCGHRSIREFSTFLGDFTSSWSVSFYTDRAWERRHMCKD